MSQSSLVSIVINSHSYGRFLPAAIDEATRTRETCMVFGFAHYLTHRFRRTVDSETIVAFDLRQETAD